MCDDEKRRVEPLIDVLNLLGYEATVLDNPSDVPTFLDEHHDEIDVILLDLHMPNGTLATELNARGFECDAREETGILLYGYVKKTYHLPVVVHSVLRGRQVMEYFQNEKGVEFLSKPASSDKIVEAIERVIGRRNE